MEHVIFNHEKKNLLITDLKDDSELSFTLLEGSLLKLSIFANSEIKNLKISAKVHKNSEILVYFADFSSGIYKAKIDIDLLEEGAKADYRLSSLAAKNDNKQFDVNITHFAINTYGITNCYGVCKDEARLVFAGTSLIQKGAIKTSTHQNAKIMVFDQLSNACAKPILKIDENDIEASHAAVVGKINEEHLFYLTSRGLSEEEAKRLITFGYLKPILSGFDDELIKNEIEKRIEERI